jgi:hypothetical protein
MPIAHRHQEGMNLLGEKGVRLLFGVGGVEARVESLDQDCAVFCRPATVTVRVDPEGTVSVAVEP